MNTYYTILTHAIVNLQTTSTYPTTDSVQFVSFNIFHLLLDPMTTRRWGAPSKWGIPIASQRTDTGPIENEESQAIPNVHQPVQHDKLLQVVHFCDDQEDDHFTHPPLAPTTPEPKLYAYSTSGIGIVEGRYVPPLPPPLPVTVHEYVEQPGITAKTQLAIPLVDYFPVDKTGITCWTQEELTMLSKFFDDIINVHCLHPDDFDTLGNL